MKKGESQDKWRLYNFNFESAISDLPIPGSRKSIDTRRKDALAFFLEGCLAEMKRKRL